MELGFSEGLIDFQTFSYLYLHLDFGGKESFQAQASDSNANEESNREYENIMEANIQAALNKSDEDVFSDNLVEKPNELNEEISQSAMFSSEEDLDSSDSGSDAERKEKRRYGRGTFNVATSGPILQQQNTRRLGVKK